MENYTYYQTSNTFKMLVALPVKWHTKGSLIGIVTGTS